MRVWQCGTRQLTTCVAHAVRPATFPKHIAPLLTNRRLATVAAITPSPSAVAPVAAAFTEPIYVDVMPRYGSLTSVAGTLRMMDWGGTVLFAYTGAICAVI